MRRLSLGWIAFTRCHCNVCLTLFPNSQPTGSRLECEYALKSFGIDLPNDSTLEWVEQCKALDETHRKELQTRIIPGPNDVLLGRGRPFQLYSGNLALAAKIDENRARYAAAKKMDKKTITVEIVENMIESGCCFLKKVNEDVGGNKNWEEVDFETARLKVSHSFRTMSKGHPDNEDMVVEPIPSISAEAVDPLGLIDTTTPSQMHLLNDGSPVSSSNKRIKW